jgi:RNA polymerase primary sigma factor
LRYHTGHEEGFLETMPDPRYNEEECPESANVERSCLHRVLALLEFLEPREREIIRLRVGLDGNARGLSLAQIGRMYGISKQAVQQAQLRAMTKLRNLVQANNLTPP